MSPKLPLQGLILQVKKSTRRLQKNYAVTLELGGKSPNIVFEDADFEAASWAQYQAYLQQLARPA